MASAAQLRPLSRIRELIQYDRGDIWYIALFAFGVAVMSLAVPIAVEVLVENLAFGYLIQPVIVLAIILFGCLSLAALIQAMQAFIVEYIQQRIFSRVTADFGRRLPRVRLEHYDGVYGPDLINRFFDVLNVQKASASLIMDGITVVVTMFVGMAVLAFYSTWLIGFDIALLIGVGVLIFLLGRGGIRTSIEESHEKYETAAWLQGLGRLPRVFRIGAGPALAAARADELAAAYVRERRAHFRVVWRQILFSLALQVVASTAILGLGGYLVINRKITLGQLVAAELIVSLIVASVAKLGKQIASFYDLCTGVEKLGLVTDAPLERSDGEALAVSERGLAIAVSVGPGVNGRALDIPAGAKVALVGHDDKGKVEFIDRVCGFRASPPGAVRVDGVDIQSVSLPSLRSQIGYVSGLQVIHGTVAENVRMGRDGLSDSDVRQALMDANLADALARLPGGVLTELLPSGVPLSVNESAQLALARALAGGPRLLTIDHALDGLDLEECHALTERLCSPDAPWTLLVATGRRDVAALCDFQIQFPAISYEEAH